MIVTPPPTDDTLCRVRFATGGRRLSLTLSVADLRPGVGQVEIAPGVAAGLDDPGRQLPGWRAGVISGARYAFRALGSPIRQVRVHEMGGRLGRSEVGAVASAAAVAVARLIGGELPALPDLAGWEVEAEVTKPTPPAWDELTAAFCRWRDERTAGNRDHQLSGRVFGTLRPPLLARALRLSADQGEAEDYVADTVLEVIDHASSFDPSRGTVLAWAVGILNNKARDVARRRDRRPPADEIEEVADELVSQDQPVDAELLRAERAAAVTEALERLPAHYAVALRLRLDGMALAEIASVTGVSLSTAGTRIHRGLERLREELSGREPDAAPTTG